jgi:protein tyrosine phosphatase
MILPFERTYWVVPGRLLAGEIPSSIDDETRFEKVKNIVDMQFDAVINLMEPLEKTFSGELLRDYSSEMEAYARKRNHEISIYRFPIKDLSVTSFDHMKEIIGTLNRLISDNKKVYVHCWGGVGRTGTVIGCYLIENKMATKHNVFNIIEYLKRTTSISHRRSPETDEQAAFILSWADCIKE